VKTLALSWWMFLASGAHAEEPDHAIHQELREVVQVASAAIAAGNYTDVLPLLTEDFVGTTLTQDPVQGREGVKAYFDLWFGPGGYMKSMSMEIEADELTDLSDDRTWGLVRGVAHEHYEAKNGDTFDFKTRWTTVMVLDTDGEWRVRAIHFGTNHLDNPVLWKVRDTMIIYGGLGGLGVAVVGFGLGWWVGRRRASRP
jgi:ketosteroid isomerase-like protein